MGDAKRTKRDSRTMDRSAAAASDEPRPPLRLASDPAPPWPPADPVETLEAGPENRPRPGESSSGNRRGLLVEFVRLIMVALFAISGWELTSHLGPQQSERLLVGTLLGAAVGYVLGGVFGRRTATAVSELEREFRRIPAAEILAGGIGMILGLVLATLLAVPLYHLPPKGAYPAVAFLYVTLGYVAYKIGRTKSEELFGLFGVKPRAAGLLSGEVVVLDSSVILDGRLRAIIHQGFLAGTLLVTRGVLDELQAVADSSNAGRRARGRKALDTLVELKRDPAVDLVLIEEAGGTPDDPVDSQLIRVARARGGTLLTNDNGLAKLAAALDIRVRSIHALAEALRPEVVAGQQVPVRLTRRGRDSGQAVGYLDDGTMVVVEEADHLLGDTVTVIVTNALQTSTGRLIFARVAGNLEDSTPPVEG